MKNYDKKKVETKIRIIQREEEEKKTRKFAEKVGLPCLNLSITPIDPSGLEIIPLEKSKEVEIIVLQRFGKALKIGVKNPNNKQTEELLEELKKQEFTINLFIVSRSSLESVWKRFIQTKKERKQISKEVEITSEKLDEFQKEISSFEDIKNKLENTSRMPVTELLNIILAGGLKTEASDVHFEKEEEQIRLRFRIDGILRDITDLPSKSYNSILSRIKILSELKINVHDVPQDGRFTVSMGDQQLEIRTSIIPGAYGENIVLRILNPNMIGLGLESLGIEDYAMEIIIKELKKPHGMIVNTGPTGSGKTTTLYAFVKKINSPDIKIITLENPIEYHLEGIEQTQINPKKDYTFAVGLRAVLRQDPDVILLGEVRDNETAETAIHAALTGHLVFTTLHTNDAAGAIPRLIDMRVNPTLIPPALNLVIAQRLVRRICKNCSKEYKPDDKLLKELEEIIKTVPENIRKKYPKLDKNLVLLKAGKGCKKCSMTSYKGRIAIMELFTVDKKMEKIIIKSPSIIDVQEAAVRKGMVTMKQNAVLKILDKTTSLEEIERVLGI